MVSGTREQFAKNLEKYFPTEKEAIAKLMKVLDVSFFLPCHISGLQWLNGRVLDSRQRGRGFEPHRCHCVVVLEQDIFILA